MISILLLIIILTLLILYITPVKVLHMRIEDFYEDDISNYDMFVMTSDTDWSHLTLDKSRIIKSFNHKHNKDNNTFSFEVYKSDVPSVNYILFALVDKNTADNTRIFNKFALFRLPFGSFQRTFYAKD